MGNVNNTNRLRVGTVGSIGAIMLGLWVLMLCIVNLIAAIAIPGWFLYGFGAVAALIWLFGR